VSILQQKDLYIQSLKNIESDEYPKGCIGIPVLFYVCIYVY